MPESRPVRFRVEGTQILQMFMGQGDPATLTASKGGNDHDQILGVAEAALEILSEGFHFRFGLLPRACSRWCWLLVLREQNSPG